MIRAAMIGTGDISGIYLKNLLETFREVELIGVCNRTRERAVRAAARAQELAAACGREVALKVYENAEEVFADPQVQVVLNLTRPAEHYAVTKQALLHGKHVYTEKPLATEFGQAQELAQLAAQRGLYLGGAPDTFLGAGIQTCRKLIEDDVIGDVIGANCAMICRGHEGWHPSPAFLYQKGGGPMFDMGPYYITALVELIGEAVSVMAMTRRTFAQRIVTSPARFGERIEVEADTWLSGNIRFANGAIAQVLTTFDVHYDRYAQARFEVYGTKGTLAVPDPNTFGGPVLLYRPEDQQPAPAGDPALEKVRLRSPYESYREVPLLFDYGENSRGLGLADLCRAIESGRPYRANAQRLLHVTEIMEAFAKSGACGRQVELTTGFARTAPMRNNPLHGILD